MMINCPKCGFSQPEDQYCAKCGVDMVAYRPKEKSVSEKFFSNTSMQFFALGVIVAICFMGYQVVRTSKRLARVGGAQQFQDLMETDEASEGAADMSQRHDMPAPDMPKTAKLMAVQTAGAAAVDANAEAAKVKPVAAPVAAASAPVASAKMADATRLRVVFAEVPKPILVDWFTDSKSPPSTSGSLTTGVIADFQTKIRGAANGWRPLEAPIDQTIRLNQIVLVYKGGHDDSTGQNVGISMQLTSTALENGGATVSISSSRNLHELTAQGPTITEVTFPEQQFTIPKGGARRRNRVCDLHRTSLTPPSAFGTTEIPFDPPAAAFGRAVE